MSLKFKFKSKDEIPADQLPFYAEREGVWMLDVEGAVDKSRLDEFRSTNISLLKERDDLKQRFEGIDPDEVRSLRTAKLEMQKAAEAQQLKEGELDKVVESRIKGIRTDLEKQVSQLTNDRDSLNTRLSSIQIDQGVITSATKRGLRSTAMADITSRARSVFRLVNGVPTAFESDGKQVLYGRDGLTPMSIGEWVDAQVAEAPHLFEANSGGGASSGSGGGSGVRGHAGKNPFKRESWNLTEQMKIAKSDPPLAARLKAAA